MIEKQSQTLSGLISTLKDNVFLLGKAFGEILLPALKRISASMIAFLQRLQEMDEGQRKLILTLLGLAAAIGPLLLIGAKLIMFMKTLKLAFIAVNAVMAANPILAIVSAVALLAMGVYWLIKNWEKVSPFFAKVWNTLIDIFEFAYGPIVKVILEIINFAKEHLLNGFVKVAEGVGKAIDWIAAKFGKETSAFESITTWIDKWVEPAHTRLTFSFDRLRVAVDKTSETIDKEFTPAVEKATEKSEELQEAIADLAWEQKQWAASFAAQSAAATKGALADAEAAAEHELWLEEQRRAAWTQSFVDRENALRRGAQIEAEIIAKRIVAINEEVAASMAAHEETLEFERAMREELARIDAVEKAEAEAREAAHQHVIQQLRQATWNLTQTLVTTLGSVWDSYYVGLLQNENLTDKERKKIMRDQARAEKTMAIFQAVIATARAIAQALPNIPLSIIAGAAGALQIAAIAAKPLPKLATGGVTPALLHPNEAIIPLDSSEALGKISAALEGARAGAGGDGGLPVHVTVNLGSKTLYDDITKATRDRRILISAGAVA